MDKPMVVKATPVVTLPALSSTSHFANSVVVVLPEALAERLYRQYEVARVLGAPVSGRGYPQRLLSFENYCLDLLEREAFGSHLWGPEEDIR